MLETNFEPGQSAEKDFPYFRGLWNTVVVALLAAAFTPLIVIGGGMYHYGASTLKDNVLASLRSEADHHRHTVDQFLAERVLDLKAAAATHTLVSLEAPGQLEKLFSAIQPGPDERYFTDLGIIDERGTHRAYAGPYDLLTKNYRDAPWFKSVMASGVYISDVFAGFRAVPHFVVAVKQHAGQERWIIRATVDAAHFDRLVARIAAGGRGDAFLLNRSGLFQTTPHYDGRLMEASAIAVPERFDGVRMEEANGKIRVMAWLDEVPWLSVVELKKSDIFAQLQRMRRIGLFAFLMAAVIIGFIVLLTTNYLVGRLETKRRRIHLMGHHLRRANQMTLSLQLYNGFFQEVNEALVNIDSAAAWIGAHAGQPRSPSETKEELHEHLDQIKSEIRRSRTTIHELISFSLPATPLVTEIDVNRLLNRVAALFRRELHYNNIRVQCEFQEPIERLRSNPSQLNQVFQNLMLNAVDAVGKNGLITLKTSAADAMIRVVVADDGPGVSPEIGGRVFEPLFTTRHGRLGLGLAICRETLQKLGGEIQITAQPGKGAAFTVSLPVRFQSR